MFLRFFQLLFLAGIVLLLGAGCGEGPGSVSSVTSIIDQIPELPGNPDVTVSYTPPYVPVTFYRSLTTGKWGIATGVQYHTAIGTFGLTVSYDEQVAFARELESLNSAPTDLLLVFQDRNRNEATVYHVRHGHDATVVMDGRVILNVKATKYGTIVSLDVTNAEVVELYPRDAIIERPSSPIAPPSSDTGPELDIAPGEPVNENVGGCIVPDIEEFYYIPSEKYGEFTFYWRVKGADRVEMWGETYPHTHSKMFIIKEPSWWTLWAKVAGTPDSCYVEESLFVEP
jgi:hypothetical protein